jgi:hypothetical protein
MRSGTLEDREAEVNDSDELLEQMRREGAGDGQSLRSEPEASAPEVQDAASVGSGPGVVKSSLVESIVSAVVSGVPEQGPPAVDQVSREGEEPLPPNDQVPSGMIWPAVDGRLHLAAATEEAPTLWRSATGWRASTDRGWMFFSYSSHVYTDVEQGRDSLVRLARVHAAHSALLSNPRCVVLANDGAGGFRLWQIARERVTLRERLAANLGEQDGDRVVQLLIDTARRLRELDDRISMIPSSVLGATLDSIGVFGGVTQFVGVVGHDSSRSPRRPLELDAELRPLLKDWSGIGVDLKSALLTARSRCSLQDQEIVQDLLALDPG